MSRASSATSRAFGPARVLPALQWFIVAVAVCIVPATVAFGAWSEVEALRAEWTIDGPPCPVIAQLTPALIGRKPPRTFRYGSAAFTRSFGAVYCAAIPELGLWKRESYRVCQFNNPGAVTVDLGGERTIFRPPPGRRATVTVRKGRASCVVGGWFNY